MGHCEDECKTSQKSWIVFWMFCCLDVVDSWLKFLFLWTRDFFLCWCISVPSEWLQSMGQRGRCHSWTSCSAVQTPGAPDPSLCRCSFWAAAWAPSQTLWEGRTGNKGDKWLKATDNFMIRIKDSFLRAVQNDWSSWFFFSSQYYLAEFSIYCLVNYVVPSHYYSMTSLMLPDGLHRFSVWNVLCRYQLRHLTNRKFTQWSFKLFFPLVCENSIHDRKFQTQNYL